MRADVSLIQHLHLAVVVAMLLAGCHAVSHGLIHFVTGVDDHLHVLLLHVFLCEVGNLFIGNQLTTGEDGLRELCKGIQQQLAWVNDAHARVVGPSHSTTEGDGGEEGRTGCCRVVESLLHGIVGHADVRTVLQHLCRYADV